MPLVTVALARIRGSSCSAAKTKHQSASVVAESNCADSRKRRTWFIASSIRSAVTGCVCFQVESASGLEIKQSSRTRSCTAGIIQDQATGNADTSKYHYINNLDAIASIRAVPSKLE